MAARVVDMTGRRYWHALAVKPLPVQAESRELIWQFTCDCGESFEAPGSFVRRGNVKSCQKCARQRKLQAVSTHRRTNDPIYRVWCAMKSRCFNEKNSGYPDYGGRGITVCDRWAASFEAFAADMGPRPSPRHTIERKNTDGNYEPGNCEWATYKQQANNKRNNRLITIRGNTKTLAQWAESSGLAESSIRKRLARGLQGESLIAPDPRAESLTFNGQKKTLEQWASETGIKKATLANRIYVYGWSLSRALTERVTR